VHVYVSCLLSALLDLELGPVPATIKLGPRGLLAQGQAKQPVCLCT
jgi:hypothetical protein